MSNSVPIIQSSVLKVGLSSNKWVLNVTDAPLFFLWTQLMIAVLLFGVSDVLRLLPDRLTFDPKVCRGLVAMVGLSILSLAFVSYFSLEKIPC
jgi:GDP-fucose transporter C1